MLLQTGRTIWQFISLQTLLTIAVISYQSNETLATVVIIQQQDDDRTVDTYYDRQAAFGPRISSADGVEGFPVAVEELDEEEQPIPSVQNNNQPIHVVAIDKSDDSPPKSHLPRHGCSVRKRPSWIAKDQPWIALVERGGCSFVEKVRMMQKSGACAVIVGNNEMSSGLITMFAGNEDGGAVDIKIPSAFIMQWAYRDLRYLILRRGKRNNLMGNSDDYHYYHYYSGEASGSEKLLQVKILPNPEFEWPLIDLIVLTVVAPIIVLVFLYSLWKYRQYRRLMDELMANGGGNADENNGAVGLLTQEEVDQLPVKQFDPTNLIAPECDMCAICLDEFETDEEVRLLPRCGHTFHCKCIDLWLLSRRRVCPICKCEAHPSPPSQECDTNVASPITHQPVDDLGEDENTPLIYSVANNGSTTTNESIVITVTPSNSHSHHSSQSPPPSQSAAGDYQELPEQWQSSPGTGTIAYRISRWFGFNNRPSERT